MSLICDHIKEFLISHGLKGFEYIVTILLLISGYFAYGQEKEIPTDYVLIKEVFGDLDKDGINERVAAFNVSSKIDDENGIDRELIIFKIKNKKWVVWKRSKEAIGNSKDGGMMGDPFEDIEIKSGVLLISQSGGSSWKWRQTDKYRFQNGEFELIGFASIYGKLCEYWTDLDYNLSTGKIAIKKEYETCETKEQEIYKKENELFNHKLTKKITIQNRKTIEIKIISPKYKHEIYL